MTELLVLVALANFAVTVGIGFWLIYCLPALIARQAAQAAKALANLEWVLSTVQEIETQSVQWANTRIRGVKRVSTFGSSDHGPLSWDLEIRMDDPCPGCCDALEWEKLKNFVRLYGIALPGGYYRLTVFRHSDGRLCMD